MKIYKSGKLLKLLKLAIFFVTLCSLLLFSKTNFNSVKESVNLFFTNIFPSLFPFILFTEVILKTNIIILLTKIFGNFVSKIFKVSKSSVSSVIIGFLCGYPMGAKTVNTLYENGNISKKDANILLSFVNNCNPAFILSTIGIAIFNNITIGIILLISHLISAILIGIIYSRKYINSTSNIIHKKTPNCNIPLKKSNNINLFYVIKTSILNSLVTLGNILGFIIIFNLLSNLIKIILEKINVSDFIITFFSGIFEITNGCNMLNTLDINIVFKICSISFLLGFSGLCILCQIYSVIFEQGFKFLDLLKSKFYHGILSFIITYIILKFLYPNPESLNVYSNIENANAEYTYYINNMKISYLYSTFAISIILLIYYIYIKHIAVKKKGRKAFTLKKGL